MVAGMEIHSTAHRPTPEDIARSFLSFKGLGRSAALPGGSSGAAAMASEVVDYAFREYWSAYICQRSPLLAKLSDGGRRGYGNASVTQSGELVEEHGAIGTQLSAMPVTVRAPIVESLFPIPFTQMDIDMMKNCGSLADLAAMRALEMMEYACSFFSRAMFGSCSRASFRNGLRFGGNGVVGLQTLVPDTGHGKAMGVNSDDFSFWRNHVINLNSMGKPTNQSSLLDAMSQMSKKTYNVNGETDIIVTTKDLHTEYESALPPDKRTRNSSAILGYRALDFKNTGVVWDEFCPEGRMYFLNSKALNLRASDETNMKILVPQNIGPNHLAWIVRIGWYGQTFMTNRQSQGVIIV